MTRSVRSLVGGARCCQETIAPAKVKPWMNATAATEFVRLPQQPGFKIMESWRVVVKAGEEMSSTC